MFVHLHVHSQFSILESSIRIEDLVKTASGLGMKAIALTDKYFMGGAVRFYKAAKEAGIKPITGCEICLSCDGMLSHLILLAKNRTGYENLCRIVSRAHLGSPCAIPAIGIKDLEEFSCGLVCLSGCSRGMLDQLLKKRDIDAAYSFARRLNSIFGEDFYIEVQRYSPSLNNTGRNLNPGSLSGSEMLLDFAQKFKIPVAATNNVHYLSKNDFKIYRYLAKLKLMGTKHDPTTSIIKNDEHYLRTGQEMSRLFYDVPAALKNTLKIADKCDFDFELGSVILPRFDVPPGESQESFLKKSCNKGLSSIYGNSTPKKVLERLENEICVISKTGFAGYFLIVADIARFTSENNIPICGKGSAAGSLVSYLLGISNVDPIENNLFFERFLNLERKEPPDIDVDISNKDRSKVSEYLISKYGIENVARVSSFVTTRPRASIREAGRLLGLAKEDLDPVIKSALNYNRFYTSEKMQSSIENSGLIDSGNPEYRKLVSVSRNISGYIRHISTHPSAFIVSNTCLCSNLPLARSETGEVMSQYDMNSIDDIGILKIDLINSLSLSLIAQTREKLNAGRKMQPDPSGDRYDDSYVYDLMQKGLTLGVFQLESFGIRTLSRKVQPSCLNDITLLVSLYRPGPQQSGMVSNFIERKFGREKTIYIHDDLRSILEETYGIILYQEQAMQIAMKIAGYTLSEADILRKAITRLSPGEMQLQQKRFLEGALSRGYSLNTANETFRLISKFASYGFVKAHAAAYAELSYKTCYLKAHYPAEFISTILTNNAGYYSKMQYIEEARRLDVVPLPPDINKSGYDFIVEDNGGSIRTPLITVRDLGDSATGQIIKERERNGNFIDFFDFYRRAVSRCRITKNAVENLIKIGAFDFTCMKRKELLLAYCSISRTGKIDLDLQQSKITALLCENSPGEFTLQEKMEMEAEILGFYISSHPLRCFKEEISRSGHIGIKEITRSSFFYRHINSKRPEAGAHTGQVISAGIVVSKRIEKTRDNRNMMFCTMEDEDGMYEAVFFPDAYMRNARTLMTSSFIIINGRLHLKDNNVTVIAREAFSIQSIKKMIEEKKAETARIGFISEVSPVLW